LPSMGCRLRSTNFFESLRVLAFYWFHRGTSRIFLLRRLAALRPLHSGQQIAQLALRPQLDLGVAILTLKRVAALLTVSLQGGGLISDLLDFVYGAGFSEKLTRLRQRDQCPSLILVKSYHHH